MTVTVYSTPKCVQCNFTYKEMTKRGIAYDVVDVTQDAAALAMIKGLGYSSAPVVIAGEDHWSGYQPSRIAALAEKAA